MNKDAFSGSFRKLLVNGIFILVLLLAIVIYVISYSLNSVSETVIEQQIFLIKDAAIRNSVQCYALEGSYPETINYLKNNYNFSYDDKNYVVHYENLGSNLLPQISVFHIGN